ncbi:hypothetical protein ACOMHN_064798 [Nucella lapillus]
MSPCGGAGYQEVEENTALTFRCDHYSGFAVWVIKEPTTPVINTQDSGYTLTVSVNITRVYSSRGLYSCAGQLGSSSQPGTLVLSPNASDTSNTADRSGRCDVNISMPATSGTYSCSPTTQVINRQDSGYTLTVSVNITQVYSSRGLYSCAGQLGSFRQPGTLVLSPNASDTSNTADRSGRCDVNIAMPSTSGIYSCSVTVNPGNTQTSCGSFTITRPSPPTISCPSDSIPENTPLTCTCNTNNIGQPGGRLRWYTGTGSDVSTEVVSASYDVTTLEMTRPVTRGDHGRKFRCVNNWMVKVNAASDYTASVALSAVVSQPTTQVINRQDSGYTLTVSVNITQVYSSRGLYSCAGQLGFFRQPGTLVLSPNASDTSNTADRSGRCDITISMPATSGTYSCSVTVNPGNTQTSCGSFTITRPSPPTISCPSDSIPENTPLTCTCNTNNIGQPGGRLRWYTGTGSDVSTEVVSASYDVPTLEMTRPVTRADHGRKFRCVNNWTVKVNAASDYTANVALSAVVSQPTTQVINRQDSGYTLTVSVNITQVYSSRGLYFCAGQLGSSSQPGTLDLSPTASDTSNTADRSGRCDVTMSMPATSGTYSCSVTVNPGNTHTPCGNFTIEQPTDTSSVGVTLGVTLVIVNVILLVVIIVFLCRHWAYDCETDG